MFRSPAANYNPDGLTVAEVLGTATPAPAADAQTAAATTAGSRRQPTRTPRATRARRCSGGRHAHRRSSGDRACGRHTHRCGGIARRCTSHDTGRSRCAGDACGSRHARDRDGTGSFGHARSSASLSPHVGIAARGACLQRIRRVRGRWRPTASGSRQRSPPRHHAAGARRGILRPARAKNEDIPGRLGTIIERQQYRRSAVVALLVLK